MNETHWRESRVCNGCQRGHDDQYEWRKVNVTGVQASM